MTADSDQEAPLDFYLTPPHPCSYLDRSDAQTLFADPRRIITSTAYQQLSAQGFVAAAATCIAPDAVTAMPASRFGYPSAVLNQHAPSVAPARKIRI